MRPSELDFLQPEPGIPRVSWLILAAGIALAGLATLHYQDCSEALAEQRHIAARLDAGAHPRTAAPVTAEADAVLAQRNWNDLLNRLETSLGKDISLTTLAVDGRRGLVDVQGASADSDAMFAYLERLRGDAGFATAALRKHERRDDDPAMPMRFTIRLQWGQP